MADLGALTQTELVELLERLTPEDVAALDIDVDAIGRAVDPRRLGRDDLGALLATLGRFPEFALSGLAPTTFARIIATASAEQVRAVMADADLRERVLTEIFRRMSTHLRADRVAGLHAVVHWRFTGGSGADGYDRFETTIADGGCAVSREMTAPARVTITLSPADFCKLVTQNASAPVLFMTGKLKARGDIAFAAGLTGLFDLPRP
ncbi:SCP2 sterol-binding domain-containing protein [Actinokineospora diospyrosa]|uniref:SCP-2 sterol transfer family protein n=1 Tax=Actinokineospora diospyrosa TaxID=103728 RepID=A0ABT1ICF6_9PSEU|nr:SCP2 sterol-binding domain-containing protein [Actinokineospora diospyrosa]MCP2270307.1 SCP-2 sterol transfer family protein [Actinokineospora diospyrosa]